MTHTKRAFLSCIVLGALLAPSAVAGPSHGGYSSDNVEYVGFVPFELGTATGASRFDNFLVVTSWRGFSIYDISEPAAPELITTVPFGFKFENEDVATNGKIVPDLSLAASTTTVSPGQSVTLSGSLVDANGSVAGAPIVVYQRPKGGRWSLAGQTTTSVDGTYALRVAPTMTTRYRAVYNGDAERWAAQSLLANVRVLQPSPSPTTR